MHDADTCCLLNGTIGLTGRRFFATRFMASQGSTAMREVRSRKPRLSQASYRKPPHVVSYAAKSAIAARPLAIIPLPRGLWFYSKVLAIRHATRLLLKGLRHTAVRLAVTELAAYYREP